MMDALDLRARELVIASVTAGLSRFVEGPGGDTSPEDLLSEAFGAAFATEPLIARRIGIWWGRVLGALVFGRCFIDTEPAEVLSFWQTIVTDLEAGLPPEPAPEVVPIPYSEQLAIVEEFSVPDDLSGLAP